MLPNQRQQLFSMVPSMSTFQQPQLIHSQMSIVKPEAMDTRLHADLYLCDSGNYAKIREKPVMDSNTSIDLLDKEHNRLTQTKIKDSLSSFVPDIPGDFDSSNNNDSMLRTLIDRPPIGGREFLPLSDQSLLGFRLHPGQLPEQYRLDPLTLSETHKYHNKKKKKHKHKHVDKSEEASLTNFSPSASREHTPPGDPCDFIKPENTPNFFPVHTPSQPRQTIHQPSQALPQSHLIQGGTPMGTHSSMIQQTTISPSFLNMVSPSMTTAPPTQPGVIKQGNKMSSYQQHMQGGYSAAVPNPAMLSTAGMKIPAKPKKKRHNVEGAEGVPKKKKKKDKDKEKSKEKRKKKHQHNPDGLGGTMVTAPPTMTPVATSSTPLVTVPTIPLSMSTQFSTIHSNNQ